MMTSPSVSLQTLLPAPAGVPLVFLVPSAGAGPGSFRSWRRLPAGDVHVVAVLAPGREGRLKERPFDDVAALAASVATAMATSITERPDAPFAVMGHSLGAVVAREALIRMDHVPRVFMAAAALPPHQLPDHGDPTDDDLIHLLERFGGTPVDILRDREFAAHFLPGLRADLAMMASARRDRPEPSLRCPIIVGVGGSDPTVSVSQAAEWAAWTAGGTSHQTFAGEHFFPATAAEAVLACLVEQLRTTD